MLQIEESGYRIAYCLFKFKKETSIPGIASRPPFNTQANRGRESQEQAKELAYLAAEHLRVNHRTWPRERHQRGLPAVYVVVELQNRIPPAQSEPRSKDKR